MKILIALVVLLGIAAGAYAWHSHELEQRQLAAEARELRLAYDNERIAELEVQNALQRQEIAIREGRKPDTLAIQKAKMHLGDAKLEVLMKQDRQNLRTLLASHQ